EGAAQTGQLIDALANGDGVNNNDNQFTNTFPYLALPNTNAVNGGTGSGRGGGTNNGAGQPDPSGSSDSELEPDPSTSPAGFTGNDDLGLTAFAIGSSTLAAALGALVLIGWQRRRRLVAAWNAAPARSTPTARSAPPATPDDPGYAPPVVRAEPLRDVEYDDYDVIDYEPEPPPAPEPVREEPQIRRVTVPKDEPYRPRHRLPKK
ncbi:MAG TPA: hypothetical protein VFC00_38240, partial [Micromonosporaceae bacterium]|nr:hypothetical protein [Micromonosporaceae bacterium]